MSYTWVMPTGVLVELLLENNSILHNMKMLQPQDFNYCD